MKIVYNGEKDRAFKDLFSEKIPALCEADDRVIYLDADLMNCIGTMKWAKEHPERAIDCGIAEANMAGIAAGLSAVGFKPIIHTFGPFASRRCFDQVFLSGGYAHNAMTVIGTDPGVCVQKKDYKNAHQTQIDIANLTKIEKEKFEKEKFRTIQKEIENLQKKQLNETKGLEQKIQSIYNGFKKNRAIKVQELLLKYKNQFRDLENKQSNDIKNLEKVVKGGMLKQGKSVNYSNEVREKNVNFNRTTGTK